MSFWDKFTVHSNVKLNTTDKFNYLVSSLKNEPLDTIRGLTLSSESNTRAVDILNKIYGNKQILISSQMDNLVKLPRLASMIDIPNLQKLLNSLEMSIRNLTDLMWK